MLPNRQATRLRFTLLLLAALAVVWGASWFGLEHTRNSYLREAQQGAAFQAQALAERVASTIKRLNTMVLEFRDQWPDGEKAFTELIRQRSGTFSDIAFQVAVIDRDGYVAYSNLAPSRKREVYLGEREHFKVHQQRQTDTLFISKPVKGKVSGKWSIQFTRPIFDKGAFAGVLVVSISPEALAGFSEAGVSGPADVQALVADGGEILGRQPDNDLFMGKQISATPFLEPGAPNFGHYTRVAQTDGVERIFGYFRLPEYRMNFVVGRNLATVLAPYREARVLVILLALAISAVLVGLVAILYREFSKREETARKLETSEAMLYSSMDTIGEAFVIYDQADRLVYCNQQYLAYYPTSADLLKPGMCFEDIIRIGAERGQYKAAEGRIDEWVAERMAAHRAGNSDLIQHLDDGRWLRIRERKTPEGYIVGFRVDITELYQAKLAAEAANVAKSAFLATMSHELRTPLNGILGMADLMMRNELEPAEVHDFAGTILESGKSLLELLNSILDLSRVEAGKVELKEQEFTPTVIVRDIQALFTGSAQKKGLTLTLATDGQATGQYLGDPVRLRQMFSNLVNNAIKFTHDGRITLLARELSREGDVAQVEFSVEDTGIGVPPDKMHLLFQRFSQVDSSTSRQYGGSGLGLSIVQSLAGLMGGEAGAVSAEGQGSRFWFRVPLKALAEPLPLVAASPSLDVPLVATPGETQVLVVEDHPTNAKVMATMLRNLGLVPVLAEHGQKGLDCVMSGTPLALVLMDLQMPVMDGFEATRAIRALEAREGRPRTPIVAVTANAFETDRDACVAAGMDDFLAKPVTIDTVHAMLLKWLPAQTGTGATADADRPVAPRAVDVDHLREIAGTLLPLLDAGKFDALSLAKALAMAADETRLASTARQIADATGHFEFAQAAAALRTLMVAEGWDVS